MALARRLRGSVLRLVRRRPLAIVIGLLLAVPSVLVEIRGGPWWALGLATVIGAVGLALLAAGTSRLGPDWIDDP